MERRHELGIRAALGASVQQLTALIVAEGAVLAVSGVALGVVVARSLAHLMTTILFGVPPADGATFFAVGCVLTALAAIASYIPARLASRADPSSLLRSR